MRESFLVERVEILLSFFFFSLSKHPAHSLSISTFFSLSIFTPHPLLTLAAIRWIVVVVLRVFVGWGNFVNEKNIKATTTTEKKEEIFFSPPLKTVWWLCIAVNRITQHSFFFGGVFCDIRVCRRCGVRKYIFCQCIEKERMKKMYKTLGVSKKNIVKYIMLSIHLYINCWSTMMIFFGAQNQLKSNRHSGHTHI